MDDLDNLLPRINKRIDDSKPASREKANYEKLATYINNIKVDLKEFHTYSEFKCHIFISFILVFLSTCGNSLNKSTIVPVNLLLLTNTFMIYFVFAFGIFLYFKIDKINIFLRDVNMKIAFIHKEFNKPQSERILDTVAKDN
jgi:hypothetical protein